MKPIVLIGGGGHCISCIDVIEQTRLYRIIGILDLSEKVGEKILDYTIIGTDNELEQFLPGCPDFLITVGQIKSSALRERLFNRVKMAGGNLPVIISPMAYISKYAHIEEGTIIMHNALINANAKIGKNCIINTGALIEHEAIIGDFCHVSTQAVVNGQVHVGKNSFLGSNSIVANNVSLPNDIIVAAGACILKTPNESGTYIGNPAVKMNNK